MKTGILEFTIMQAHNEIETIGEVLSLSFFGEYCPPNSLRGYSLEFLLTHPEFYKASKIVDMEQIKFM